MTRSGSLEIRHLGIRISSLRWPAARFLIEHSDRALVHGFRILV